MAKRTATSHKTKAEIMPADSASSASISKAEAIRQAIEAGHADPASGTKYIWDTFGIKVTKLHFSSSKSQNKKKQSMRKPVGSVPKGRPRADAIQGYLAPPPRARSTGDVDLLESLEALKPLVASLGAEKVKRLADLLEG